MSPRLQQVRDRLAHWLSPPSTVSLSQVITEAKVSEKARQAEDTKLRRLLSRSMDVIESLEMRNADAQATSRTDWDLHTEIMGELQEAAALADGAPWRAGGKSLSHAGQQLQLAVESVRAQALKESKDVALRETIYGMAELEIALDDRGWKRLIARSQYEFSRFGIQSIILICRLYYIKNPLARRGIDCSAIYVFGRGLEISSSDEAAHETLTDFFGDPRNASQFSHTALVKKEQATYTDGNVFWAYFADPSDGRLQCRGLDAIEISDIITDPNDAATPWFYRRDWTEQTFDEASGRRDQKQRSAWYAALGYEDIPNFPATLRKIEDAEVAVDTNGELIPVQHLKDGDLPGWRFGCPREYPILDWLRAYRHVLEDLCTLWRALSRFAWNVETKGGAPAIAAFKQTLATTLANDLSQIESNPPPVTGSAFISGPNNKIEPMKTGGTTMNPDSARRVLLMICAGFGLNENMMGDASTGSLATAESLERSVELMFKERQEVWREVLQRQGRYALQRSLRAPKGKLREAVAKRQGCLPSEVKLEEVVIESAPGRKGHIIQLHEAKADPKKQKIVIEVKFPDILQGDIGVRIKAISEAMTLDGKEPIGIDEKTGIGLLLSELGVEDVQSVVSAMYPEDTYEPDRTLEPELPTRVTSMVTDPQADATQAAGGNQPDTDAPPPGGTAPQESISRDPVVIDKAVRALLETARRNLERQRRIA